MVASIALPDIQEARHSLRLLDGLRVSAGVQQLKLAMPSVPPVSWALAAVAAWYVATSVWACCRLHQLPTGVVGGNLLAGSFARICYERDMFTVLQLAAHMRFKSRTITRIQRLRDARLRGRSRWRNARLLRRRYAAGGGGTPPGLGYISAYFTMDATNRAPQQQKSIL
ncbi:hypothetical protein MAPG_02088 [Magnaporthiopsis poae ATCC 64411]|uniref:Uncharacterized protein n=1 Tax=Magnaporthiopsis poae (strain ATCC 64411 / 73-15) TaxID=644358 RepID=A0A0C4DQE8_MAGP6|nr:hypothetical protein MAPG_02088 [Magnaporthiopsis poae ATCC 64411]